MRHILLGAAMTVAVGLTGITAATAVPRVPGDAPSVEKGIESVQWRGRYCERLRRACVFKEERGEVGEGNCRRYRRECGRY